MKGKKQTDIVSAFAVSLAPSPCLGPATPQLRCTLQVGNPYHPGRRRGKLLDLIISKNIEFTIVMSPEFRAYEKELNPRAQEISD